MATAFPPDFVFGVATSSYQIEGAAAADGRAASIWDTFCRIPDAIANGDTGDRACDHYHRYREDIALMRDIGVGAYRFSVSWPRVVPKGRGSTNPLGLDFYDRLTDELLEAGIAPWVCLYHWDLPQALQDKGGWENRDLAGWFSDYAMTVIQRLGDRAAKIAILNEPSVVVIFGHLLGVHAPGLKSLDSALAACHHLNLATATSIDALRSLRSDLQLGTILSWNRFEPAADRDEDLAATRRVEALWNDAGLAPLLDGRYPDELADLIKPFLHDDDPARLARPLDFLGLNYYTRLHVRSDPGSRLLDARLEPAPADAPKSATGLEVYPEGLLRELATIGERFDVPPLYVTENGIAVDDQLDFPGEVHDDERIDYLAAHLDACLTALHGGVDLRGYFVWSLLDNFEWTEGYGKRFGLAYVDFETLARTPKDSFYWYAEVVRRRALP